MEASVAIQSLPAVADDEELCRIVDEVIAYWREHDCRQFGAKALDAAKAGSRVFTSNKDVKVYNQDMNFKIDKFLDAYFGLPFKNQKKGKWK